MPALAALEKLIIQECDIEAIDQLVHTALSTALNDTSQSSCEIVEMLLLRKPTLVSSTGSNENTRLLHQINARSCHNKAQRQIFRTKFNMVVDAGAPNEGVSANTSLTALGGALIENDYVYCQALIERGARTDGLCSVDDMWTILHIAALHCNEPLLKYLRRKQLAGLDVEDRDIDNDTVWDCFISVLESDELFNYQIRSPDFAAAAAFIDLYTDVRDRNLQVEIDTLGPILASIKAERKEEALDRLGSLVSQKEKAGRSEAVDTYRTIRLQVQEQMWEAAMEAVEEKVEVLREAMASSPWMQASRHDGPETRRYRRLARLDCSSSWESTESEMEDEDCDTDGWLSEVGG